MRKVVRCCRVTEEYMNDGVIHVHEIDELNEPRYSCETVPKKI